MVEWILVVVLHGESNMYSSKQFEYSSKSECIKDSEEWKDNHRNVVSSYCKKLEN
jgi:hypothetical protein